MSGKKKTYAALSRGEWAFDALVYAVLIFALLVVAYPLLYVLSASFSAPSAVSQGRVFIWPVKPTLLAYRTVLGYHSMWTGFGNSLLYMTAGTAIALVMETLAAYPLSRKEFVGRGFFTLLAWGSLFSCAGDSLWTF